MVMGEIGIILCRAEGSANLGAVCRVMKNMGLRRLLLADCPQPDIDTVKTHALSAFDIYENAITFDKLEPALAGFDLCAAFTRRTGKNRIKSIGIEAFANEYGRRGIRAALVFGNEKHGLNDSELELCDLAVSIPGDSAFPSLNLSHAVALAAWEMKKATAGQLTWLASGHNAAGRMAYAEAATRMAASLKALGFFKIAGEERTIRFLAGMAARAGLDSAELLRFEKLFSKYKALAKKTGDD